jgi:glycosyltransferase involved in cell wall biosynthesis
MIVGFWLSAWNIKKYIRQNKIELVITHSIVLPSGALAAKLSGIPHIWYIHEYADLDHQLIYTYGKKKMLFLINAFSKKIIVNSKALKEHFSEFFNQNKTEQVYYVVEYPLCQPSVRKQVNELAICIVGRVADGKNQMVLFKALTILNKEGIVPSIVFVGGIDRPYKILLDEYYTTHALKNEVQYIGYTNAPWEYVQHADCVLVCSRNEAFGRVTVEAMKTGKVAVVSNTGAGKELIEDGITGFLFDPEDAFELAHILKKLWFTTDLIDMTTKAQKFALAHFNKTTHLEVLKRLIEQCK